jgi:predicted metalloprotease
MPQTTRSKELVRRVLGDTEDVWGAIFRAGLNTEYRPVTVVLFSGIANSSCGEVHAQWSATYCGLDQKIYVDPAFLDTLTSQTEDGADFAKAYVITHAVGHHVQFLHVEYLSATAQTEDRAAAVSDRGQMDDMVARELQADCFVGVWAYFAKRRHLLQSQALVSGLPLALSIGDPKQVAKPEDRKQWFERGLAAGNPNDCEMQGATLK